MRFTRESHQPFRITAHTTVNPMADPHAPSGERSGKALRCAGFTRLRKETWAARDTTQDKIIPKNAARRMNSKALAGVQFSSTSATTMPYEETSRANLGEPCAFNCPSRAGAQPLLAMEKSMREET